jgi:hypothetical protein
MVTDSLHAVMRLPLCLLLCLLLLLLLHHCCSRFVGAGRC